MASPYYFSHFRIFPSVLLLLRISFEAHSFLTISPSYCCASFRSHSSVRPFRSMFSVSPFARNFPIPSPSLGFCHPRTGPMAGPPSSGPLTTTYRSSQDVGPFRDQPSVPQYQTHIYVQLCLCAHAGLCLCMHGLCTLHASERRPKAVRLSLLETLILLVQTLQHHNVPRYMIACLLKQPGLE
jgi:hypothetical protein